MSESFFAPDTKKYIDSLSEKLNQEGGLSEEVSVQQEEEPETDAQPEVKTTDADPDSFVGQESKEYVESLESDSDDPTVYGPSADGMDNHTLLQNNVPTVDNDEAEKKSVLGAIGEVGSLIKEAVLGEDTIIGTAKEDISKGVVKEGLGAVVRGAVFSAPANALRFTGEVVEGYARAGGTTGTALASLGLNLFFGKPTAMEDLQEKIQPGRREALDKVFEDFAVYDLAHAIERKRDELIEKPETVTGSAIEGLSQFLAPYGMLSKIGKAYRGYRGAYVKEAITGIAFFDPDDQNLTTMLKEYGYHIPIITDILAKDEEDSNIAKRIKSALEAVLIIAPFDAGKITDDILIMHRHKRAVEKGKLELLQDGVVSEETAQLLEQTAEAMGKLEPVDIELMVRQDVEAKVAKYSDRIRKVRGATEANKKKIADQNRIEADKNLDMHNAIVEDFESKLSINNGLDRTDPRFFHVTKKVFGKRVLDTARLRQAKNMEARPTFEQLEASKVTDTGDSVAESMIPPRNSQRELDDLYNITLKPENIEALTVVFSEMKKARPDLWNDKKPPMKAAFDMIVKLSDEGNLMDFTKDHPLYDALNKAGMSFEDFTVNGLGAASEAGQILRNFRKIKESHATKSLKREYELRDLLSKQGTVGNFMRRVENIRRGGLVSQIATAARNLSSGLLRSPVEAINNVVETAVYDFSRGGFRDIASNRVLKRTTWQDSFAGLKYIYRDRKTAEEFTDFLLEEKELKTFYDRMFNTINEIQTNTGRGTGTKTDAILSAGEDMVQLLNTPNRWQDFVLRRATFLSEAERLFRLEWDIDLLEELENGRLRDILRDAEDLNPTKGQRPAVDLFAEATERALDLTYANPPEVAFNRWVSNFIVKNNLTVAIPFPRFMFKSMELMAENSAGAFVPIINKAMKGIQSFRLKDRLKDLKKIPEDKRTAKQLSDISKLENAIDDLGRKGLSQRESRAIARNLTGVSAITAASIIMGDKDKGEDYKLISDGMGGVIDTTPLFPLRQFLFLGKIGRDWYEATKDIGGSEAAKEAFFNAFPRREWAETFLGTNFRLGVGGNLLDEAATLFTERDLTAGERLTQELGETLGEYLSSFLVPLNQVLDAQRALELRNMDYRDFSDDPSIFPESRFTQGLLKPFKRFALDPDTEKERPLREDPFQERRERKNIGLKVIAGINMYTDDSEHGKFLKEMGYTKWDASSKSLIPTVRNYENKLIREELPEIVDYLKDRRAEYEQVYEDNRETLSSGRNPISKKLYVKKRIREDIDNELKFIKNNLSDISEAVGEEKAQKIETMIAYRKLPLKLRTEAELVFKEENDRDGDLKYSYEEIRKLIPDYDTYTKEEQDYLINEQKLMDLEELYDIATIELKRVN